MQIPSNEVEFKRKVGKARGHDIYHLKLCGGLHVMALDTGTILGAGPHRAVARHLAQQFEPEAEWTALSKSDHVDFEVFEHLLPRYEEITLAMRAVQGTK